MEQVAIMRPCAKALRNGTYWLKDVRRLIDEQSEQSAFGFAQSHSLIGDLKIYSDFNNRQQCQTN
jgi:hypothetical protein